MRIPFAVIIVIIYWLLDSYQDVLNYNIDFIGAIFLNFDQASPQIKILTSAFIFIFMLLPTYKKKVEKKADDAACSPQILNAIYKIAETTISTLPLHKQINSVVEITQKYLKVKTAFVGSFKNDHVFIINTNESLKTVGIKEKYLPHHGNLTKNSLDSLLSIVYLEKRELVDDIIEINDLKYRAIIKTYKDGASKQHIGVTGIIVDEDDKNDYSIFLSKVCEQVAFSVNLIDKKDETIKTQNKFIEQLSSIDSQLNIPSNNKIQETIEREMKRSHRYHTELSIMLIEIDYMQNLSNIFTEKETLTLKKEIVSVLKKLVRETDTFGKWTGEHFAIIAPNIDFRATKYFADKISKKLKESRFTKVGKITCSYGITSYCQKDTSSSFRQRAENALNAAIERGGNSIEVKILV